MEAWLKEYIEARGPLPPEPQYQVSEYDRFDDREGQTVVVGIV